MQHFNGTLGLILHKVTSNLHFVVMFIMGLLFIFNLLFYTTKEIELSDILLDKTFENVDEIYINNEFGRSMILKVPHRSRIIVQKKELGTDTFVIRVDVLK